MFHPGYSRPLKRSQQILLRREKLRKAGGVQKTRTQAKKKEWFLLTDPSFLHFKLEFTGIQTMTEATMKLLKYKQQQKRKAQQFWQVSEAELEHGRQLFFRNQKVRAAMNRLARIWLRKRIRLVNTDDPITCSEPSRPVYIIDWPSRTKYVFEADSLLKYIVSKLTLQDNLFPIPTYPRNILTNEIFTRNQFLTIQEQLANYHLTHWIWDAFVSMNYQLRRFQIVFDKPLRNYILTTSFRQKNSETVIDTVIDYIESEVEFHGIVGIPWKTIIWAVENKPNHIYILKWKNLCKDYYEQTTIYGNTQNAWQFHAASKKLLETPNVFGELNRLYFSQRSSSGERRPI